MIDININNINKSYGTNNILNNINMTINEGEKVGLIGSNGSGKTTLLKIIANIENIESGSVSIRNGASIGILKQIPDDNNFTVKEYIHQAFDEIIAIEEKLKYYESLLENDYKYITKYSDLQEKFINMGGYEYETKIQKIVSVFDIKEEMLDRKFNTLSGGEKTIISLVRLLLQEPNILLLDEPTNHLDIKRLEWLEKFLSSYKGTVILVTHDRYFMDKIVNKIYLITKRGMETYHGNYTYFVKENENRIFKEFKDYKNQQKMINAMKNSIKRLQEYGRLCGPSGGEIFYRRAASIEKRLEKIEVIDKPTTKQNLNINFSENVRSGNDIIKITNLYLSIGDKELFKKANLNLYIKEKACLIGPNGSGKTTIIKKILKNDNINLKIGSNIKMGYIPQEIRFDDENLSVIEEARKYLIGLDEYLRSALFKYLFVNDSIYKKIKYLSGGERVRLKLFCLLQNSYNFLILDEPTNHIDIDTREMLESALNEFKGTILFVSHDRYFINKIANSILEINNKRITKYIGTYDDYKNINNN